MTLAGSSPNRPPETDPAAPLPRSILLAAAGAGSIVAVVVLAIAIRSTPFPDLDGPSKRAEGTSKTTSFFGGSADDGKDDDGTPSESAGAPSASSRELRAKLSKEVNAAKTKDATATLEALVAADPRSLEDADVRRDVLELAGKAAFAGGSDAQRVFDVLTSKAGTRGPDVLYALATTKGGSKGAERAVELLQRDDVRERATPATRIAFDLWKAKSCPDKAALLERARDEGDERALGRLMLMGRACRMSKDPQLKAAMEAIRSRTQ